MPARLDRRKYSVKGTLLACMLPRERALVKHITCARTAVEFRDQGKTTLARMAAHDARNNFGKWCFLVGLDKKSAKEE